MSKYLNGKIYKLISTVDDLCYIGSTLLALSQRKANHKCDAKLHPNQKVYQHFNSIGWNKVEIILLQAFPCETKAELEKRERYWIDLIGPTLNTAIPCRTQDENKMILDAYKNRQKAYLKTAEGKQQWLVYRNTDAYKAIAKKSQAKYIQRMKKEMLSEHYMTMYELIGKLIDKYTSIPPISFEPFKLE